MNTEHICLNCMSADLKGNICPFCGFDNSSKQVSGVLPHRKMLADKYMVGHAISKDGDSVTYMGYDTVLKNPVHIREFFPDRIARRVPESFTVSPKKDSTEIFNHELVSFLRLSRALATMKELSGLFSVYDIVEENGTAYAISEHIMSMTLEEYLLANDGMLVYEKVKKLFVPFLDSLSLVHSANVCHLGISPSTVYMCEDGKLRLDGFAMKSSRMATSVIYTPQVFDGYAAPEQYRNDEEAVGEKADVYSVAAVLFRSLIGKPPMKATDRLANPRLIVPTKLAQSIPPYSLSALANALTVELNNRTPSIDQFRDEFLGIEEDEPPLEPENEIPEERYYDAPAVYRPERRKKGISGNTVAILAAVAAFVIFIGIGILLFATVLNNDDENVTPPEQTTAEAPTESTGASVDIGGSTALDNLIGAKFTSIEELENVFPNLKFERTEDAFSDKYDAGYICAQEPAGNQDLPAGTVVKITVSKGESTVKIPSGLKGKTFDEATALLQKAGYKNIRKVNSYDGSVGLGKVVRCDPEEGTSYDVNNLVVVHVNVLDPDEED